MANARAAFGKLTFTKNIEKTATTTLRWDALPYLMVVLLLLTGVSLFHVWSRFKVIDYSLQITETARLMKEAEQDNARLRLEVASLKTPARIEGLAKDQLGMALPTDQQVVAVR
jgi:cell division protein FtsL